MAGVTTDRLYRGVRTKEGTVVTVHLAPGESHPLGGTGRRFDWGRPTEGALGLADELAREALGDDVSPGVRERFFHEIVLTLPFIDPWVLWCHEVQEWAEKQN